MEEVEREEALEYVSPTLLFERRLLTENARYATHSPASRLVESAIVVVVVVVVVVEGEGEGEGEGEKRDLFSFEAFSSTSNLIVSLYSAMNFSFDLFLGRRNFCRCDFILSGVRSSTESSLFSVALELDLESSIDASTEAGEACLSPTSKIAEMKER